MFIGRFKEQMILLKRWKKRKPEFVVIYGRRRVGKTALISKFCQDKPHVFFTGLESSAKENLQNFSQSIHNAKGSQGEAPVYSDFEAAFLAVAELARDEQIVLVIDEYPYLAAAYPGISSLLQRLIDHEYKSTKIFLILCGSSMSFMENQVLGAKSPLFGRRTAQIKLNPMQFSETRLFHSEYSMEEQALCFGIVGGIPLYQRQIENELSLEENIKQNILETSSYLFEEPTNFLKQEVREPACYNAIAQAIATGSSKLNQIATKTGLESSACVNYLKNLTALSIVKRETPLGEKNSRNSIYKLADPLFRFWYRFIPRHYSQLQNGMVDNVYSQIEPFFNEYMGSVFEDICMEWLWGQNAKNSLPFNFAQIGRWWGTDKRTKTQVEIDIIGEDKTEAAIFSECKWRNEPVDTDVIKSLQEKSALFPHPIKFWYIFSKRGFTKECEHKAKLNKNIRLITFEEMHTMAAELY